LAPEGGGGEAWATGWVVDRNEMGNSSLDLVEWRPILN
jgi:hypothetical protein